MKQLFFILGVLFIFSCDLKQLTQGNPATKTTSKEARYAKAKEHFANGYIASELDKHDEAIREFTKSIEFYEGFASYYNRAISFAILGDCTKAIEDNSRAIFIVSNTDTDTEFGREIEAKAYYNRSYIYRVLGKINKSKRDFYKAEKLGVTPPEAGYITTCGKETKE